VRLAHALDGYLDGLGDMVEVETQGETWFRYRTGEPGETNPAVLARLASQGARVLTLSEVPRSLEDVYLRIVEDDDGG
jgi:ABC-2 type transport system ATP-binding protein